AAAAPRARPLAGWSPPAGGEPAVAAARRGGLPLPVRRRRPLRAHRRTDRAGVHRARRAPGLVSHNPYALPAIIAVTAVTVVIGAYGLRLARTTSDLLVASRTVSPRWNAAAISGEYLSAASFLGVAGLILKEGVDMLWYPVGFAAGYLALLLFVAAPLRRSGAFTLPDFCEARLRSRRLRKLATAFVIFI